MPLTAHDSTPERQLLHRANTHALAYLDGLPHRPVGPTITPAALRGRLVRAVPDHPTNAVEVKSLLQVPLVVNWYPKVRDIRSRGLIAAEEGGANQGVLTPRHHRDGQISSVSSHSRHYIKCPFIGYP